MLSNPLMNSCLSSDLLPSSSIFWTEIIASRRAFLVSSTIVLVLFFSSINSVLSLNYSLQDNSNWNLVEDGKKVGVDSWKWVRFLQWIISILRERIEDAKLLNWLTNGLGSDASVSSIGFSLLSILIWAFEGFWFWFSLDLWRQFTRVDLADWASFLVLFRIETGLSSVSFPRFLLLLVAFVLSLDIVSMFV